MEFIVALIGQNRIEDARHAVAAARRVLPDLTLSLFRQFLSHTSIDYREQKIDALRKAGLPE